MLEDFIIESINRYCNEFNTKLQGNNKISILEQTEKAIDLEGIDTLKELDIYIREKVFVQFFGKKVNI